MNEYYEKYQNLQKQFHQLNLEYEFLKQVAEQKNKSKKKTKKKSEKSKKDKPSLLKKPPKESFKWFANYNVSDFKKWKKLMDEIDKANGIINELRKENDRMKKDKKIMLSENNLYREAILKKILEYKRL